MSTIFAPQFTEVQKQRYDEWSRKKLMKKNEPLSPFEKVMMSLKRSDDHYYYYGDFQKSLMYADEVLKIIKNEMKQLEILTDEVKSSVYANIDSLRSQAILRKAMCWRELKRDYHEVLQLLVQAVRIDPSRIEIYNQIAVVCMKLQKWEDSLNYLDEVLSIRTEKDVNEEYIKLKYWSLCNKAISLAKLNKLDQSKECLYQATKLIPSSAVAYDYLINITYESGNLEEALQFQNLSTELKKNKSYIDSHLVTEDTDELLMEKKVKNIFYRAKSAFINGKYKDTQLILKYALEILDKIESQKGVKLHDALEVNKITSKIYRLEALLNMKTKWKKTYTIESMEKSLSFNPNKLKSYFEYARILYSAGHLEDTLKAIERTLSLFDPNEYINSHYYMFIDLFVLKADTLNDLDKRSESLEVLKKVENLLSDKPISFCLAKLNAYIKSDMEREAIKEIDNLMKGGSKELIKEFDLDGRRTKILMEGTSGGEEILSERDLNMHESNYCIII